MPFYGAHEVNKECYFHLKWIVINKWPLPCWSGSYGFWYTLVSTYTHIQTLQCWRLWTVKTRAILAITQYCKYLCSIRISGQAENNFSSEMAFHPQYFHNHAFRPKSWKSFTFQSYRLWPQTSAPAPHIQTPLFARADTGAFCSWLKLY